MSDWFSPGAGGFSKTRLAIAAAEGVSTRFTDGCMFVDLASVREPALVIAAIARSVGIRELGERTLLESLTQSLRGSELLLVLDNFEQVVPAATDVAQLLSACPRLKVLVTSRESLGCAGSTSCR